MLSDNWNRLYDCIQSTVYNLRYNISKLYTIPMSVLYTIHCIQTKWSVGQFVYNPITLYSDKVVTYICGYVHMNR